MSLPLNPFYSTDEHEYRIRSAIQHVWKTYGDAVSVEQKGKSLLKFGRNNSVGDDEMAAIVEYYDTGTTRETWLTDNSITGFVSDDTGDAGTEFTLEGATLDTGVGFTFKTQQVTCNGQTPVKLVQPLARSTRLVVNDLVWPNEARPISGTIAVYDTGDTTVSNGVVANADAVKLVIFGDTGEAAYQSQKCATFISHQDYYFITEVGVSFSRDNNQATRLSAEIEYRTLGGVWKPLGINMVMNSNAETFRNITFDPVLIVPKNSDVRIRAISSRVATEVTAYMNGYLAKVMTDTL